MIDTPPHDHPTTGEAGRTPMNPRPTPQQVKAFYHTPLWQQLRKQRRCIDGNRCVHCGSTDRISVDHIIPLSDGGWEHRANLAALQSLCHTCHWAKTRNQRRARARSTGTRTRLSRRARELRRNMRQW
jgi:5-methylcytosine-specific restriction endonuclease McrA